jgi:enamine deaminase RidA (YjgF/YER057c/UK114 family)
VNFCKTKEIKPMTQTLNSIEQFEATLPPAIQPIGSYVTTVQVGNLVYTSGALPIQDGTITCIGTVGDSGTSVEAAQNAARLCGMNLLSVLKEHLGSLNEVQQVVKLTGYVNSDPSFSQQAAVVNGASNLMTEVFGEKGRHARTSVGVSALPLGASVEVDLIVQVML